MLLFKSKLFWKLSYDDESLTKLSRESKKTLVEWFWRVLARVRPADTRRISKLGRVLLLVLRRYGEAMRSVPLPNIACFILVYPVYFYTHLRHGQYERKRYENLSIWNVMLPTSPRIKLARKTKWHRDFPKKSNPEVGWCRQLWNVSLVCLDIYAARILAVSLTLPAPIPDKEQKLT